MVTWNPQVATQLCLASEEDHYPVIQLWDLRFATSPVKIFEGHEKLVLQLFSFGMLVSKFRVRCTEMSLEAILVLKLIGSQSVQS